MSTRRTARPESSGDSSVHVELIDIQDHPGDLEDEAGSGPHAEIGLDTAALESPRRASKHERKSSRTGGFPKEAVEPLIEPPSEGPAHSSHASTSSQNGQRVSVAAVPHDRMRLSSAGSVALTVNSASSSILPDFDAAPLTPLQHKRLLVETFLQCCSSPMDLKAMLDIVTHGIEASFPHKLCQGKRDFFFYLRPQFQTALRWTRRIEFVMQNISILGNHATVQFRYERQPLYCCVPLVTMGIAEFEFEEFTAIFPEAPPTSLNTQSAKSSSLSRPLGPVNELSISPSPAPSGSQESLYPSSSADPLVQAPPFDPQSRGSAALSTSTRPSSVFQPLYRISKVQLEFASSASLIEQFFSCVFCCGPLGVL